MADLAKIARSLRICADGNCLKCDYWGEAGNGCYTHLKEDAADAIEELLAAEPPLLWTDEPIEGTEFMTHSQGGRKGFEIHLRNS